MFGEGLTNDGCGREEAFLGAASNRMRRTFLTSFSSRCGDGGRQHVFCLFFIENDGRHLLCFSLSTDMVRTVAAHRMLHCLTLLVAGLHCMGSGSTKCAASSYRSRYHAVSQRRLQVDFNLYGMGFVRLGKVLFRGTLPSTPLLPPRGWLHRTELHHPGQSGPGAR